MKQHSLLCVCGTLIIITIFFPVSEHRPYPLFSFISVIYPIRFPPPLHFFSFFHFCPTLPTLFQTSPAFFTVFNLTYSFTPVSILPLSRSAFLYSVVIPLITLVFLFSSSSMAPFFCFPSFFWCFPAHLRPLTVPVSFIPLFLFFPSFSFFLYTSLSNDSIFSVSVEHQVSIKNK